MGGRRIQVTDTTIRDGQQSLWATRMTTGQMLPIARQLDEIGFECIEIIGNMHYDVAVRYLQEDPWDRLRSMKKIIRNTPFSQGLRSRSAISFGVMPDDVLELYVQRIVANGVDWVWAFDALFDLDNVVDRLILAKRLGARTGGALVFCESPVHTDELYASKAREYVERADVDYIMIKDSGGLLTPDRLRTLVPAIRAAVGDRQITLHSHGMTGLAPLVYVEGVQAGVDSVQCSIAPLANGPAQPALQNTVRNLRLLGYDLPINDGPVNEVSDYLVALARQEGRPLGAPYDYDAFHYQHQLPGGMLTNLEYQLQQAGMSHMFHSLLEEVARVRSELGWPIMVTPFSQHVANQALLNILHKDRYKIVPDEVKKYALGHYGQLIAPIDPDVLDRIIANGSKSISGGPQPLDPMLPKLRKQYPKASDEEILLRAMIPENLVNAMYAVAKPPEPYRLQTPVERLVSELAKRPDVRSVRVEKGDFALRLDQ